MKTLAVVIGNNEYYSTAKLENAVNDANAMAAVFIRLGYDVIHKTNCSVNDCSSVLEEFEAKIGSYDATIFYFAGHGFQLDGENYLASIECQVASPTKHHCSRTCIRLTEILDILLKHSDKVNIIIVDACRKSFERGPHTAFTPIQAPKGTLIAFSTSPNDGAKDGGMEGHSIYTGSLLKYIGREFLSVEELFKKVRKTVYTLTEGTQTTWEHTSLIGDFYFNTGQLVHSVEIPYDEGVVKDANFKSKGDQFGVLIEEMKSVDWDRQNPAIEKAIGIRAQDLDKNQQFILGRNLLQCAGYAFSATNYFEKLSEGLKKYSMAGENHVLNGILYEIYFNSHGEFRQGNFKTNMFDEVMALRKNPAFKKSFEFIQLALAPHRDSLYWIPTSSDEIIDVDIVATNEKFAGFFGDPEEHQVITKITALSKDLTEQIGSYGIGKSGGEKLRDALANFLLAPKDLININCNIPLITIAFPKHILSKKWDY